MTGAKDEGHKAPVAAPRSCSAKTPEEWCAIENTCEDVYLDPLSIGVSWLQVPKHLSTLGFQLVLRCSKNDLLEGCFVWESKVSKEASVVVASQQRLKNPN